jgi:hypothetical protein
MCVREWWKVDERIEFYSSVCKFCSLFTRTVLMNAIAFLLCVNFVVVVKEWENFAESKFFFVVACRFFGYVLHQ